MIFCRRTPNYGEKNPSQCHLTFFIKKYAQYVRLKAIMAVTMETSLLRRLSNHSPLK